MIVKYYEYDFFITLRLITIVPMVSKGIKFRYSDSYSHMNQKGFKSCFFCGEHELFVRDYCKFCYNHFIKEEE